MRQFEQYKLNNQAQKKYLWQRFKNGCKSLRHSKIKIVLLLVYYVLLVLLWFLNQDRLNPENMSYLSSLSMFSAKLLLVVCFIAGTTGILVLYGTPMNAVKFQNEFRRIGLINNAQEPPVLISKELDKQQEHISIYEFDGAGIPLSEWEDKRQRIEAILNVYIVSLKEGKNKRRILLYTVPAGSGLPDRIIWKDAYLIKDSATLVLGKSLLGTVTVNLAKIPHILLGGSTGSGKSVLLKLLLMQAVKKGACVCVADFKGGVDFPAAWHKVCRMCFDEDSLLELLDALTNELMRRKSLFKENGCPNLDAYNKLRGKVLRRLIFACDEVAEILDRTGLNKEKKEKVGQIENRLSMIARQGRAFGIHLILATQRPDATIIPGQIRSNMDCRICGKADSILSQIVLENSDAADLIPKDSAGRFLLHDGTLFQAYLFDEERAFNS